MFGFLVLTVLAAILIERKLLGRMQMRPGLYPAKRFDTSNMYPPEAKRVGPAAASDGGFPTPRMPGQATPPTPIGTSKEDRSG